MSLNLSILNGHMARAFTDLPLSVYWQGKAIAAVRSTPSLNQVVEVGGPEEKIEYDLFLRSSDLPRIPKEGDIFTVDKLQMRVQPVRRASESGELIACGMGFARIWGFPLKTV
jgi:hypothetical protein